MSNYFQKLSPPHVDVEVRIQVHTKQKTPLNVIQVGQSG